MSEVATEQGLGDSYVALEKITEELVKAAGELEGVTADAVKEFVDQVEKLGWIEGAAVDVDGGKRYKAAATYGFLASALQLVHVGASFEILRMAIQDVRVVQTLMLELSYAFDELAPEEQN